MTNQFTTDYFKDRSFYQVQAGALLDNPDQRITNDVRHVFVSVLSAQGMYTALFHVMQSVICHVSCCMHLWAVPIM